MTGQHTFLSKVTSRGADMFRAVSLCFLFIHKQRPTVITPSFKYQRPPLKESQRWPLVRAHDFSWKTHPRGGNFYSMQAQRFSSLQVYFRLPYIQNNRNIPKHALLILLSLPHSHTEGCPPLKGAFRGTMLTSPLVSCDISIALHSD